MHNSFAKTIQRHPKVKFRVLAFWKRFIQPFPGQGNNVIYILKLLREVRTLGAYTLQCKCLYAPLRKELAGRRSQTRQATENRRPWQRAVNCYKERKLPNSQSARSPPQLLHSSQYRRLEALTPE